MFDLEQHVTDAVRKLVTDGKLAAMVESHVSKMLDSILADALRSYGDIGKQIQEAVKTAIAIDPAALGLHGYNQTVLAIVKQKLDAEIQRVGIEKLSKDMDELLGTNAPAAIKLSKLIEEFKEWAAHEHGTSDRCTIIFEESCYVSRWLYLDKEHGKKTYECQFSMLIPDKDGAGGTCATTGATPSICRIKGRDPKQTFVLGTLYGFEKTLFQMYAAGTKIIVDETEFYDGLEREGDD